MLVPGNPARFLAGVLCALAVPPRTVKHTTTTHSMGSSPITAICFEGHQFTHMMNAKHISSLLRWPKRTVWLQQQSRWGHVVGA